MYNLGSGIGERRTTRGIDCASKLEHINLEYHMYNVRRLVSFVFVLVRYHRLLGFVVSVGSFSLLVGISSNVVILCPWIITRFSHITERNRNLLPKSFRISNLPPVLLLNQEPTTTLPYFCDDFPCDCSFCFYGRGIPVIYKPGFHQLTKFDIGRIVGNVGTLTRKYIPNGGAINTIKWYAVSFSAFFRLTIRNPFRMIC